MSMIKPPSNSRIPSLPPTTGPTYPTQAPNTGAGDRDPFLTRFQEALQKFLAKNPLASDEPLIDEKQSYQQQESGLDVPRKRALREYLGGIDPNMAGRMYY